MKGLLQRGQGAGAIFDGRAVRRGGVGGHVLDLPLQFLAGGAFRVKETVGCGHELGVVEPAQVDEHIGVAVRGFGAVGAKGKRLFEGEFGFFQQALLFLGSGGAVGQAPGVDAADGAAQFAKGFLRVVVAGEFARAFVAAEIHVAIGAPGEVANFLGGGFRVNPVADQALGVEAPEEMVFAENFFGELFHRFAVDLHDDAERGQVRVHPIQGQAFLDVEFVGGVGVEDHFGQQAVDLHDGDLAIDHDFAAHHAHAFVGFELAGLEALAGFEGVFVKTPLAFLGGWGVDFRGRVHAFAAAAVFDVFAQFGEKGV